MTWEEAKKEIDGQIDQLRKTRPDIDKLEIYYIDFTRNPEVIVKTNTIVICEDTLKD